MTTTWRSVAVVLAVSVCPLVAQVAPTQTGQRLDANLEVGSGGYNPMIRSRRIDSQLYITGQVTGLRGFHGPVGYVAANELRVFLPSESLDSFRTRSIGLGQINRGGGTFRAEAYYRRTATALGVRDILAGRSATGSNIPMTSRAEPTVVNKLYREATENYTGLMDTRVRARGQMPLPLGSARLDAAIPLATARNGWAPSARTTDFGISIFTFRGGQDDDLADALYNLHRVEARLIQAVEARVDADASKAKGDGDSDALPPLPRRTDDAGRTRGGRVAAGMPPRDEDVFLDLLAALGRQRGGQVEPAPGTKRDGHGIVQFENDDVVLNALAGRGRDLFNRYMTRAREELNNGKFYQAASEYERAAIVSPGNPLARMGLCVAYYCAGEPLTSAQHLRRAFAMFPELMRTRVDIRSMMGTTVLRHRLVELDRRLADERAKDERMLVLVLTFVHRNVGNENETRRYAVMLRDMSKNDKVLSVYAKFVLTGEMPKAPAKPAKSEAQAPPGPGKPEARNSKS